MNSMMVVYYLLSSRMVVLDVFVDESVDSVSKPARFMCNGIAMAKSTRKASNSLTMT